MIGILIKQVLVGILTTIIPPLKKKLTAWLKKSLTKDNLIKFLDQDGDGDFDLDDIKLLRKSKKLGQAIAVVIFGVIAYFAAIYFELL